MWPASWPRAPRSSAARESGGYAWKGCLPERDGILALMLLLEMCAVLKKPPPRFGKDVETKYGKSGFKRIDVRVHRAVADKAVWAAKLVKSFPKRSWVPRSRSSPFSVGALFLFFVKVGSVLFGSGYVLLAFLRADLVERWHWLSESQLLDAIAVGQVTPGPLFTTATFIGYLLGGPVAAVVATVGIFLPAFFFVAISGPLVPRLRASPVAGAFLDGVNVASLALMGGGDLAIGRGSTGGLAHPIVGRGRGDSAPALPAQLRLARAGRSCGGPPGRRVPRLTTIPGAEYLPMNPGRAKLPPLLYPRNAGRTRVAFGPDFCAGVCVSVVERATPPRQAGRSFARFETAGALCCSCPSQQVQRLQSLRQSLRPGVFVTASTPTPHESRQNQIGLEDRKGRLALGMNRQTLL